MVAPVPSSDEISMSPYGKRESVPFSVPFRSRQRPIIGKYVALNFISSLGRSNSGIESARRGSGIFGSYLLGVPG